MLALRTKAVAEYSADRDMVAHAGGAVGVQNELSALATSNRLIVEYQPALVPGRLQLRTRIGGMTTATLRAQLAHLAEMSELTGHTFAVVPFTAAMPFTPLSGWSMYDRDLVDIEALDGVIQLTEPAVVARYAQWLDHLLDVARVGPDAAEYCRRVAASWDD